MHVDNIKRLVNYIEACYPGEHIFVKNMMEVWTEDKYLLQLELTNEQRDELKSKLEKHGKVPSLADVRAYCKFIQVKAINDKKKTCSVCNGSGWLPSASEFDIVDGQHVGMVRVGPLQYVGADGVARPHYYRVTERCTNC